MPRFDISLEELTSFRPDVREPADFDTFWSTTLAAARSLSREVVLEDAHSPFVVCEVFDLTFTGFAGDPVRAWLLKPAGEHGPLPAVVEFTGYGSGRGLPSEHLRWAAAGFAHIVMDTRGQGSVWGGGGQTPDPHGTGPSTPGFMTRGIESPLDYYYRRVFTDAVCAVDAARSLPFVDGARVAVTGASQGGGITIAAAALSDGLVAVMPDVPFLCHYERAFELTSRLPYHEVVQYLSVHRGAEERVLSTLSYFDGVNFAARATAPALFSVALMDDICPPSTVYAAYNRYRGQRQINVYPYNEHEGGQAHHWLAQHAFLTGILSDSRLV
ncbi:MAG: acetylxylan esterase [Actinobacteria bacterium]|nr:acetylxylan esterase [Actinomycetota bacterium]